jgi:hypothetical protein
LTFLCYKVFDEDQTGLLPHFSKSKNMPACGPKQTSATALQMSAFGGTADIGLPQTYRYRALSVAVLIVTLCKLGAVHMAVGVVLSAIFWVHIY